MGIGERKKDVDSPFFCVGWEKVNNRYMVRACACEYLAENGESVTRGREQIRIAEGQFSGARVAAPFPGLASELRTLARFRRRAPILPCID